MNNGLLHAISQGIACITRFGASSEGSEGASENCINHAQRLAKKAHQEGAQHILVLVDDVVAVHHVLAQVRPVCGCADKVNQAEVRNRCRSHVAA